MSLKRLYSEFDVTKDLPAGAMASRGHCHIMLYCMIKPG